TRCWFAYSSLTQSAERLALAMRTSSTAPSRLASGHRARPMKFCVRVTALMSLEPWLEVAFSTCTPFLYMLRLRPFVPDVTTTKCAHSPRGSRPPATVREEPSCVALALRLLQSL